MCVCVLTLLVVVVMVMSSDRLYSKLTRRKVAGLDCHGLQHLISLFLVLSLTIDIREAVSVGKVTWLASQPCVM